MKKMKLFDSVNRAGEPTAISANDNIELITKIVAQEVAKYLNK